VNLRREPNNKLPAETPVSSSFRQGLSVDKQQFNPFLDDRLHLRDNARLSLPVAALSNQRRGTPNVASIIVAPFYDFKVTTRGFFDFGSGYFHIWLSATALRTSFSW
jgi:hypothetical protein